jgi:hypothetical protein
MCTERCGVFRGLKLLVKAAVAQGCQGDIAAGYVAHITSHQ